MRTTLSVMPDGRVAGAGDYLALGLGNNRTPGWRHAVVDFDYDPSTDVFALQFVGDIDTRQALAPALSVTAMNNIERHCRAYRNLIERLTNAPA